MRVNDKVRALSFRDADTGHQLEVHYDNKGDPYRDGVTLAFSADRRDVWVMLEYAEIVRLRDKLTEFLSQPPKKEVVPEEVTPEEVRNSRRYDLGDGFFAVPRCAVTLSGHEIGRLNDAKLPYDGPWVIIMPDGRAAMGEDGKWPYRYTVWCELVEDKNVIWKHWATRNG